MRGLCGVYEMSIVTPLQDTGIANTLAPPRRSNFVQTQNIETITRRALAYLNAGFSVHFRGPAGTGKTTLALEVAALLNRPTVMIAGDEDMATATLVGSQRGYHYRKVVDRFIHNVTKTEETAEHHWADHRLTTACREGYTLIYDEFTRSRPEAQRAPQRARGGITGAPGAESERALHHGASEFPHHLHQQSAGICRRPRGPGCAWRSHRNNRHGVSRPRARDRHRRRPLRLADGQRHTDRRSRAGIPPHRRVRPDADPTQQHHDLSHGRAGAVSADRRRPAFCAGMSRHPWRENPVRRKDRRQAHAAAQDAAEPYRASLPSLRGDRRHRRGDGTCLTIEPRTTGVTRLAACTASPRCRRSPTAQSRANASIWPPASPGSKTSARASSASS